MRKTEGSLHILWEESERLKALQTAAGCFINFHRVVPVSNQYLLVCTELSLESMDLLTG